MQGIYDGLSELLFIIFSFGCDDKSKVFVGTWIIVDVETSGDGVNSVAEEYYPLREISIMENGWMSKTERGFTADEKNFQWKTHLYKYKIKWNWELECYQLHTWGEEDKEWLPFFTQIMAVNENKIFLLNGYPKDKSQLNKKIGWVRYTAKREK